jgi:hypothetical protein
MANELTLSGSIKFAKSNVEDGMAKGGLQVDVTGSKCTHMVQAIGTSEEAIDIGDIGTSGYMFVVNRDTTNYVSIRPGTGTANCIKLKAGEFALFRIETAPWAIANTAACNIEFLIVEN